MHGAVAWRYRCVVVGGYLTELQPDIPPTVGSWNVMPAAALQAPRGQWPDHGPRAPIDAGPYWVLVRLTVVGSDTGKSHRRLYETPSVADLPSGPVTMDKLSST